MIHSCLFVRIRVAPQANNADSDSEDACDATRICTNTHVMFQELFMIHSCLFVRIRVAPQANNSPCQSVAKYIPCQSATKKVRVRPWQRKRSADQRRSPSCLFFSC